MKDGPFRTEIPAPGPTNPGQEEKKQLSRKLLQEIDLLGSKISRNQISIEMYYQQIERGDTEFGNSEEWIRQKKDIENKLKQIEEDDAYTQELLDSKMVDLEKYREDETKK